jgi:hypothetical protein
LGVASYLAVAGAPLSWPHLRIAGFAWAARCGIVTAITVAAARRPCCCVGRRSARRSRSPRRGAGELQRAGTRASGWLRRGAGAVAAASSSNADYAAPHVIRQDTGASAGTAGTVRDALWPPMGRARNRTRIPTPRGEGVLARGSGPQAEAPFSGHAVACLFDSMRGTTPLRWAYCDAWTLVDRGGGVAAASARGPMWRVLAPSRTPSV